MGGHGGQGGNADGAVLYLETGATASGGVTTTSSDTCKAGNAGTGKAGGQGGGGGFEGFPADGGAVGKAGDAGEAGDAGLPGGKGAAGTAVSGVVSPTPALTISPTSVPGATAGTPYSVPLTAKGGTGPLTWSAFGLPPGLTLNPSTGTLSGTPTAAGTYPIEVLVTGSTTGTHEVGALATALVVAPSP
jgi:hypothetical protein